MIYTLLGVVLLLLVVLDLLWTTLWTDGAAGPLTARSTTVMWRGLRRLGGPRSRLLSLAGPLIITATLVGWIALLWLGWTLVFAGDGASLMDTRDGGPVSWVERQYFVAYSMFTMGNGDFAPRDGWPQVATSLTTASGMLLVTMGVTYVLSVLTAVNQKRAFASSVWGLGRRAEDVVATGWDGTDLHALDLPLNSLRSELSLLADRHTAYPVLHYYHSEKPESASVLAVAILDETLTLVETTVAVPNGINRAILTGARATVDSYLETLGSAYIGPADEAPPPPDVDRLAAAGIPTRARSDVLADVDALDDRRRMLLGVVRADAWQWPSGRREVGMG